MGQIRQANVLQCIAHYFESYFLNCLRILSLNMWTILTLFINLSKHSLSLHSTKIFVIFTTLWNHSVLVTCVFCNMTHMQYYYYIFICYRSIFSYLFLRVLCVPDWPGTCHAQEWCWTRGVYHYVYFLYSAGYWAQGFVQVGQALYWLSIPRLCLFVYASKLSCSLAKPGARIEKKRMTAPGAQHFSLIGRCDIILLPLSLLENKPSNYLLI